MLEVNANPFELVPVQWSVKRTVPGGITEGGYCVGVNAMCIATPVFPHLTQASAQFALGVLFRV